MKSFDSDVIPLLKEKKILDLGCGVGALLDYGAKGSLGVDCDNSTIKEAHKLRRNVIYGKLPNVKVGGKFEVVILNNILEHLPSLDGVQKTLKLSRDHLKEGGLLIVRTPYAYDSSAWSHWQHQRVFTIQSLIDLLKMQKFQISDAYTYWHLPVEEWFMRYGMGNYPFKFTRRDYILKPMATFNIIRNITVIAKR